jgi:hypothetical protein
MAENTSIIKSSIATAGSQSKRDFAERIRRLYSNLAKIACLVKGTNLDAYGNVAYSGKGMIGKEQCLRMDPEFSVFIPAELNIVATGGGATTANVADTTIFGTDDVICNSDTGEVAIVNTLTSDTVLTVTAVTGGTWSCANGNNIKRLGASYEEGTRRYNTISRELTISKTYLQIVREGIAIAETAKNIPQYTNEDLFKMYNTNKMVEFISKLEGSLLFSAQSSSATTSVTIGGTAYPLYTMKGLTSWSGAGAALNGSFSWDVWNTVMYEAMPLTLNPDETVYALMGRKLAGTMNMWASQSYLTMGENTGESKFGKKVKTFVMGGGLEVEPIVHNLFETGAYANSILFFQSSDLAYLYMKGLDIKVRQNAQLPDEMADKNVIECAVGLKSISNGQNVKLFTGCLAA